MSEFIAGIFRMANSADMPREHYLQTIAFNINAPLGGYKQSGVGREYSEYGFDEFLEIKSMQL